jgi:hypothetical protein
MHDINGQAHSSVAVQPHLYVPPSYWPEFFRLRQRPRPVPRVQHPLRQLRPMQRGHESRRDFLLLLLPLPKEPYGRAQPRNRRNQN